MRCAGAQVAGALRGLRRLELARRGTAVAADGNCRSGCGRRAALRPGRRLRSAALRRHRHRRRGADFDRRQRVRPCTRRWCRARLPRADWRRTGHRQVDAAPAGGGALRQVGRARALQLWRGVRTPDQIAWRAARRGAGAALHPGGDLSRAHPRGDRAPSTGLHHRRLGPDGVLAEIPVGAGQYWSGARIGDAAAVCGEGAEHPHLPRRPRHQGRRARRSQGARAHRRHGAVFRGREASRPPGHSRGQEPLRGGQRAGRVRDDRPRPARGGQSLGVVSRRAARRRARAPRCCRASKGRGHCSSKFRRWSAAAPTATLSGWRVASIATG